MSTGPNGTLPSKISPTAEQQRLGHIFFPYATNRLNLIEKNHIRFVHYTNAEAAMNILHTKEIWMRESSCMNDFREVVHGLSCLEAAYKGGEQRLKRALDRISDGMSIEVEKSFDGWVPNLRPAAAGITALPGIAAQLNAREILTARGGQ